MIREIRIENYKSIKENPSFKIFIEEIQNRNIVIQEDDF
jgi:AAA15 family ATPase/GTPase